MYSMVERTDEPRYVTEKLKPVFCCEECQQDILEGEEYFDLDGWHYHKECLERQSFDDLMKEYLQIEVKIAEVD